MEWIGGTRRSTYKPSFAATHYRLSQAAYRGDWPTVFEVLERHPEGINAPRFESRRGFAVLHHAAWQGAGVDVAKHLIDLGAWRTLRTYAGHTPLSVAQERWQVKLYDVLEPVIQHPVPEDVLRRLEAQLHLLIRGRSAEFVLQENLRLPQVGPLTELTEPKLWFPVPGQYGGFRIELYGDELQVSSWNRVVGGWAQTHRLTYDAIQLIENGWDLPR